MDGQLNEITYIFFHSYVPGKWGKLRLPMIAESPRTPRCESGWCKAQPTYSILQIDKKDKVPPKSRNPYGCLALAKCV